MVRAILIQLATGGGKTALAAAMIKKALGKGNMIFFVVHRRDLITQTSNTFKDFKIPHGFIASGKPFNPYMNAYICSIDTLKNRLDSAPIPKIVFVDECHLARAKGWQEVVNFYKSKGSWIIGLSATPWRLDGKGLGTLFDDMVCGPSMRELIDQGYLSDYRYFAPSSPDLSGIRTVAGDYNKGQLSEMMEKDNVIVGNAISHYKKHCKGMRAVAYCCSIKHSKMVAENFRNAGIPAEHMDGETPDNERRRIITDFATGKIKIIANVDLITTGFDLKNQSGLDVTIDAVILLRPTKSLSLYLQMVGRALRQKDYPAIILDHANCSKIHDALPCDKFEWSLEGAKKSKNTSSQSGPRVIQCITDANGPGCFYCYSYGNACPECGKPRAIKEKKIEEVEGELAELSRDQKVKAKKMEQGQARTLEDLIELGKKRNMKYPAKWASRVMAARLAKKGS